MSKPLELTWYEQDEDGDYIHPAGYFIPEMDVEDWMEWKRLTDAELAATYFMLHSTVMQFLGYMDKPGSQTDEIARDAQRRLRIVERFASLPHYDEVAA